MKSKILLLEDDLNLNETVSDYFDENVSIKVVKIIQSYTDLVNRKVWQKY